MFNGTPPQIFLSYAKEDRAYIENIYQRLKKEGYKPWLDSVDLLPGQHWEIEIPNALRSSDFIIVFFSSISISKQGYVQKEFKLALEILDTLPDDRICIIPVRLDDCIIPDKFRNIQVCDLREKNGFARLLSSINLELQKQAQKYNRQTQFGFFQKASTFWSGYKIAALGEIAVGKSTLLQILTTGSMPQEYMATLGVNGISGSTYKAGNLEVKFAPTFDVGGEKHNSAMWSNLVRDSDIVLYLVFANRIMQNDMHTIERVKSDVTQINMWLSASAKSQRIAIVGTHADLDSHYTELDESTFSGFVDKFRNTPPVEYMVEQLRGASKTPVIVGSLKDAKESERLLYSLFSRIL